MQKHFTNKAKREALAKSVNDMLAFFMGNGESLAQRYLHPLEWEYRREDFETARGKVSSLSVSTCPYGVSVHIKFSASQLAPVGSSSTGKWNHYILTNDFEAIQHELTRILYEVRPNGLVRSDRPDMGDYWEARFAAETALRAKAAKNVA